MKNIIIFDFDSTLVTIEGIDELARMKGIFPEVSQLTNMAMDGHISLEDVFEKRLNLIRPTLEDIHNLSDLYEQHLTPGAQDFIRTVENQYQIFVVSGGYYPALLKTTTSLGIRPENVFGNKLFHTPEGEYAGFDHSIPLWRQCGKAEIIKRITKKHKGRCFIIGDGMSDADAKTNDEIFIHFGGVIHRPAVAQKANFTFHSFDVEASTLLISI